MHTGRHALLTAITALITISACLGVLVAFYGRRVREYSSADYRFEGDFPIEADDVLGFVPVRNGTTIRHRPREGLSYRVFTNERRARVDSPESGTPPRVSILTVGCSFSWGQGVENEETYTAILGRKLRVPVANLAFASYGTTQSLQMLGRNLDLSPRLVVYGFIDDHLARNLSPCAPNFGPACLPSPWVSFDALGRPVLRPPRVDLFDLNRRFWLEFYGHPGPILRRAALVAEADLERLTVARGVGLSEDAGARQKALVYLLAQMREKARSAGAEFLVVYIPDLKPAGRRGLPRLLRRALQEISGSQDELLDLTPAVTAHYSVPEAPVLRGPDRHPSAAGHRLIADNIEALIRSKALLNDEGRQQAGVGAKR